MCIRETFNGKAFKLIFKEEVNWPRGFFLGGGNQHTMQRKEGEEASREQQRHDYTF